VPLAGHGLRSTALRRPAGRPQLKRDPLGGRPQLPCYGRSPQRSPSPPSPCAPGCICPRRELLRITETSARSHCSPRRNSRPAVATTRLGLRCGRRCSNCRHTGPWLASCLDDQCRGRRNDRRSSDGLYFRLCLGLASRGAPVRAPPNKRLKLAGGDRSKGSGALCAGAHELSFNKTARGGRVARSLSAIR